MTTLICYSPYDEHLIRDIVAWMEARQHAVELIAVPDEDSLINRLRALAPAPSDRVVVALSQITLRTAWMRQEVLSNALHNFARTVCASGGVPAMIVLKPCEVPLMLHNYVNANFANKSFEAACQELLDNLSGSAEGRIITASSKNRVFRTWNVPPVGAGTFALVMEIGVSMTRTLGLFVEIDTGVNYTFTKDWFGPPNTPKVPSRPGGPFFNSELRRRPPLYTRKFTKPTVTPSQSYYLYLEANEPLHLRQCTVADAYGRTV